MTAEAAAAVMAERAECAKIANRLRQWLIADAIRARPAPVVEPAGDGVVEVLREAERLLDYFGNKRTAFVGPGTPTGCIERIRATILTLTEK